MHTFFSVLSALLIAGAAAAAPEHRPTPLDSLAKAPPVQFRSAFDGYRPFADQELVDWRKANDGVRAAAGKPQSK